MPAALTPYPADGHVHALAIAPHPDDHLLDQQADDPLPVCCRRARCLPQRRQVLRQRPNLLTLDRRSPLRLAAAEPRVFLLPPPLLLERLLPAALQLPGHQPVLGLDRVVLPPCPLRLVAGALQFLLPQLVQPR